MTWSSDIHVRGCWHITLTLADCSSRSPYSETARPLLTGPRLVYASSPQFHRLSSKRQAGSPRYPRYPEAMTGPRINLHLVSDATGETLNAIARATTVQFEQAEINYHRWSLIRTRFQLHRVLEGIEHEPDRCCPPLSIGRCVESWRRHAAGWMCQWSMCSTR